MGQFQTEIAGLESSVKTLETQHSAGVLRQSQDVSPKELGKAASLLHGQQISLPPNVVIQAGRAALRQVSINSSGENWEATADILGYVSFLNGSRAPTHVNWMTPEQLPHSGTVKILKQFYPPGWTGQMFMAHERVGAVAAAELHPVGESDLNRDQTGPPNILLKGGALRIDGLVMKRIVVEDAEIIYSGGPVDLQDVYFVNCRFSIANQKRGLLLATSILSADGKTNFMAS